MRLGLAVALLLAFSSTSLADTVFRCRMNARASRDFQLLGRPSWCGPVDNCGSKAAFGVTIFSKPSFDELSYREFLVSLDDTSETVGVKSLWFKGDDGKPLSEQFDAHVVSRDREAVFFVYINPTANKVHSYALDLEHRKLVAASVMRGATSLVTEARTFDCE